MSSLHQMQNQKVKLRSFLIQLNCIQYFRIRRHSQIFQKDKMRIVKAVDAEKQYINRFPEKLKRWYKKSNDIIFYDLTSDSSTDVIVNRAAETINVAPRIKAEYKPYKSFTDEQKSKVNIILDHILAVNCSNDKEQHGFLLKIISKCI